MRPVPKIPPPEEWHFEAFPTVLTGARLYFCFTYEYARCVPWIVNWIKREQREGLSNDLKIIARKVSGSPGEPTRLSSLPEHSDLLLPSEEFPSVPFLKSRYADRPEEEFPEIPSSPALQQAIPCDEKWVGSETYDYLSAENLYSFEVNWKRSPDAILSAFKKWIDENHPREGETGRGTSRARVVAGNLKALGVWRLLKWFNGDISKARKIVDPARPDALYAREEDWLKARNRAQRIIDDWNERSSPALVSEELRRKTS